MNTIVNILLRVAAGIAALVAVQGAKAVDVCASSSQGLQYALDVVLPAAPDAVTIRVVEGVYHIAHTDTNASVSVSIAGGYLDCNTRDPNPVPGNTFIDVPNDITIRAYSDNAAVSLTLDGLEFANGDVVIDAGYFIDNDVGHVTMKRVTIANGFVTVGAFKGNAVLENVVLDRLRVFDSCAFRLWMQGDSYANLRFVTAGLPGDARFCIDTQFDGNNTVDIVDSLFWKVGGSGGPVLLQGTNQQHGNPSLTVHVINSGFAGLDPTRFGNWTVTNQLVAMPNWADPTNGDYHWQFPSPGNIDAGTSQIPHGSVPPVDIDGNPRPYAGSPPDPGAYEFQVASVPATVVTTAADVVNNDGWISLREAIQNANLNGGGHITFNILGGNCPHVILLSSPLDPITTPITIDGTTQPGSTVNASPDAFDAQLCVTLLANGASVSNALKVPTNAPPSASLTVRGVSFGGFDQSIMLLGGNNHLIAGNQFGGTVGGSLLPGSALNAISIGGNATGSLIIGGDNAVDRNVIDGSSGPFGNAISVQSNIGGCQIVNNLIGIDADGITPRANTTGINITGSGCDLRANRVGNSTYNGIWIQGDDNVVEQNIIGVAVDGSAASNGGQTAYGILISGSNNTIGVEKTHGFDGQFHANDIRFNAMGGVVVTGGMGNTVRGNVVSSNGIFADGSAMDIDLGADGVTGNLVPNPGTGPNGLQNHPVLTALRFIGGTPNPGTTNVPGELDGIVYGNPGTYKVDAYFAESGCESDGRGHAESYIASQDVTVPTGATSKTFSLFASIPVYAPLHTLVANQTDAAGNSSELSPCFVLDTIFKDGVDY